MRHQKKRKIYRVGLPQLAIYPLILAAGILSFIYSPLLNEFIARGSESPANSPWAISNIRMSESYANDKVFSYSIIKILKNYYVDNSRVENTQIIGIAADGLDNLPGYSATFEHNKFTASSILGTKIHLELPDLISDELLLDTLLEVSKFMEVQQKKAILNSYYVLEKRSGIELLLNAMLTSLDAHSSLLTAQDFLELKQGTEGAFGGLGILVGVKNRLLTVIKPLARSPALRAGIKERDQIVSIDDQKTFGKTLDQLIDHMRGEPGSKVSLLINGAKNSLPRRLNLTREIIQVDSVEVKDNPDKSVLHIFIDTFSAKTSREVYTAIINFRKKNHGYIKGLILDLRSNPGGLLDQAIQVADLFIEEGPIVSTKGRIEEIETAEKNADQLDFPIAVILNNESASASEIVAGSLQDHQRAIIIGQPSFGKGSVQTIFELPESRALKLTIARYYTPLGRSIQSKGIIPDVWLQPIYKNAKNINLLGKNHYINESYLHNSLKGVDYYTPQNLPQLPVFKGYYLKNADESTAETDSRDEEIKEQDHEVETALLIFERLRKIYPKDIPIETNKSTHWLALAANDVSRQISMMNSDSQDWLLDNFGLDWRAASKPNKSKLNFKIVFNPGAKQLAIPQGRDIETKIAIVNQGRDMIPRASLFLGSEHSNIMPTEILLGSFKAGESKIIPVPLHGPSDLPNLSFKVNSMISIDSEPIQDLTTESEIFISKRSYGELFPESSLKNEIGGKVDGAVEATEQAELKVMLKNSSKMKVKDLKIKIVNLSGAQVGFLTTEATLSEINSLGSSSISFPFIAGSKILEKTLDFGLIVESEDLQNTLSTNISVSSVPSSNKNSSKSLNLSH